MKYETRLIPVQTLGEKVTKLDALIAKRDALRTALKDSESRLDGLDLTPCGLTCGSCGKFLITEEDLARHYVIDPSDIFNDHLNLGNCPNR